MFPPGTAPTYANIQAIPTPVLWVGRIDDVPSGPIAEEFDGISPILGEDGTPIFAE